jgi:hypothetical protein
MKHISEIPFRATVINTRYANSKVHKYPQSQNHKNAKGNYMQLETKALFYIINGTE